MKRRWKILIAVLVVLGVALALNTVAVNNETKGAEVTVDGGRILELPNGRVQVTDVPARNEAAEGAPIVLVHCYGCSLRWWDRMVPILNRDHRVIRIDLLGHGGSEKPTSGYSIPNQADLVAQALGKLGVKDATVVGHSLGGGVAVALAEQSPELVGRIVILDTAPGPDDGDLGTLAKLSLKPVVGQALWRIAPDASVRKGLEVAFAPGFDVPDAFVDDVDRMTYSAYKKSHEALGEYQEEEPLDQRVKKTGKPLLVIMGAEEQIIDNPEEALQRYGETNPDALTNLIQDVGHSPNVEEPTLTATMVITFDAEGRGGNGGAGRRRAQNPVQNREAVR